MSKSAQSPQRDTATYDIGNAIRAFGTYNADLAGLYLGLSLTATAARTAKEKIARLSADLVASELRRLIPVADLRSAGSFFTGDALATKALDMFHTPVGGQAVILDPACGAGNLLVACSKRLPVQRMLTHTLQAWGKILHGYDLYPEFVEATKLHVILEAIERGAIAEGEPLDELKQLLPGIRRQDGLKTMLPCGCTHVFLNPPYRAVSAPETCTWGEGKVNEAALFTERYLTLMKKGCNLVAILPEVLRCGSRYEKWREWLGREAAVDVFLSGQFDAKTQIDVFIASCSRRFSGMPRIDSVDWQTSLCATGTVGDVFEIHVGAVVPHRHALEGSAFPYARVSGLPRWGTVEKLPERCGFAGTKVAPPFVAIRRTSSPADRHRAVGTLVVGDESVAVENHLIVAKPRSGGKELCKQLLAVLQKPSTHEDLNRRIRCRHLTVTAVCGIAWPEECNA